MEKDHGLVIHTIKYGETGVVARIFTREGGLLSFMLRGVRKPKARIQNSLLQPLTQVDLIYARSQYGGLNYIKEIACNNPYRTIPYEIFKTTIALFLCELLSKTLKESDPNPDMFDFFKEGFDYLDQTSNPVKDFHLVFLVQMSRHLGFFPRNNFSQTHCYFNLREGIYQTSFEESEYLLDKELSGIFQKLTQCPITRLDQLDIKNAQRRQLLRKLVDYFRIHLAGFKELKSLQVLESVMH
jgi:DNA repair protein RecO (recombination protein O)